MLLVPVPSLLTAWHLYVPSSDSRTGLIVRLGSVTSPPLNLLLPEISMLLGALFVTNCQMICVAAGLASTVQTIVTEVPILAEDGIDAVTVGTSGNNEQVSLYITYY